MMATSMKFRALARTALDGPLKALHRRIVRNAASSTLSYWDDYMLRDVGLTRFDIINAIRESQEIDRHGESVERESS